MWFIGFASLEWEEKTSNLSLLAQLVIPNLKVKGNLDRAMYGIEKWTVLRMSYLNQGNKSDGDWKPQAYQEALEHLNSKLHLNLTKDNLKNRFKVRKSIMVL